MKPDMIESMKYCELSEDIAKELMAEYAVSKKLPIRYKILRLLCVCGYPFLEAFFKSAISKERYLDMKILAIKGYAQFASESAIDKIMAKFCESLANREVSTPLNYQEYEYLRGVHALPYLVNRYQYKAFVSALNQLNAQYDRMPDEFKGIFTTNEHGDHVMLMTHEESSKRIASYRESQRPKQAQSPTV